MPRDFICSAATKSDAIDANAFDPTSFFQLSLKPLCGVPKRHRQVLYAIVVQRYVSINEYRNAYFIVSHLWQQELNHCIIFLHSLYLCMLLYYATVREFYSNTSYLSFVFPQWGFTVRIIHRCRMFKLTISARNLSFPRNKARNDPVNKFLRNTRTQQRNHRKQNMGTWYRMDRYSEVVCLR